MTFPELARRLHAVMDTHGISHRHDLTFLSEIAWVLDVEIGIHLLPIERTPTTPENGNG